MKSRWADSPGKRGGGAKEDRRDIPPTKKPADSAGSRTPTKKPSASLAKAEEDEKLRKEVERRREWLRSKLQFHSVAAQEIYRLGDEEDWSERSLQRTLKDIGGHWFKHDGRYLWTLAEKGDGKRRVQVDTQPDTL